MNLQEQFLEAVTNSRLLAEMPDNEILLQLYSLYKQATEGDAGEYSGGSFDFVAKYKYGAWEKLKGMTNDTAMQQYVDLVNKLRQ